MNWVNIKLHRSLLGHPVGMIRVKAGADGQPADRYWRDRLKDAETDGCCKLIPPDHKKKTTEKKEAQ